MALFPIMNIIYTIKTIYSINLNCFCCHCPFDISVGVGAFVIGLSQISSFLSLSRRLDSCPPSPPPFCVNLVLLATTYQHLGIKDYRDSVWLHKKRDLLQHDAEVRWSASVALHSPLLPFLPLCQDLFVYLQTANGIIMQSPVVLEMKHKRVKSDTIIIRSTSLSFPWNTISKEDIEPTSAYYCLLSFHWRSGLNKKKITKNKIEFLTFYLVYTFKIWE